ncbi:MAG: bifunctional diaminohydroxyphosphoribosylaminopyrimidine deaminase/5-amino-6-(5-phosphoribosylamino)uracil reductase RibD [Pseudomonadales bacterium]|nr:bifunctional diaminohydroxyphosphoribosylaminopyrimidine deaminase/5-amino-6-(5-phosphoribosylamino)uracil reductase RibD [Pseudomonadales bacterium]
MRAATLLASKAIYQSPPNPAVGCLLVTGSDIIGRGWTQQAGGNHAEIQAILDAQSKDKPTQGATAYVSLEPCCFQGRTPACTEALVQAGITRVVCAEVDPNPRVSGRGIQALKEANVEVEHVVLQNEFDLNVGFARRMRNSLPWVRVKSGLSLDSRTAMASGESQWITGEASREDVQYWRARSCAILTGVGTVQADNPRLTVRGDQFPGKIRQPLRIVLDSELRSSPKAQVYDQESLSMVVTLKSVDSRRLKRFQALSNTQVLVLDGPRIELKSVMEELARMEINEVLVEAGAKLTGAFFESALWDEAIFYIAPKLMGCSALPLVELAFNKMSEAINFKFRDMTVLEPDIRIRALPVL